MQEISPIKNRILQYLDNKGITKYKFYVDSGITRGVLDKNSGISEDNIAKFIAYEPEINPEWLLTGKGEMFRSEKLNLNQPEIDYQPNKNVIPLYEDVHTVGGSNIVANMNPSQQISEYIDAGDWFPGATAAIRHYGDSMVEYPSGCILALKEVKDRNLIVWGRIYCVETSEYRVTKRLYDNGDAITACSTNQEVYKNQKLIHPPFSIPKKSIIRLFMVLGYVVKEYSNGPVFISK